MGKFLILTFKSLKRLLELVLGKSCGPIADRIRRECIVARDCGVEG